MAFKIIPEVKLRAFTAVTQKKKFKAIFFEPEQIPRFVGSVCFNSDFNLYDVVRVLYGYKLFKKN